MPPWSDVRTFAQSLGDGDDYVTFLDVLPLQRLAQSMMHMPEPTLLALVHLHDAPHVTLGAKHVLQELLRGYSHRAQLERRLGLKTLGRQHHRQILRLQVGQTTQLALPAPMQKRWQLQLAPAEATAQLRLEVAPPSKRHEERFTLHALAPGVITLTGHLVSAPTTHRSVLPNPTQHGVRPQGQAGKHGLRLTVIVEAEIEHS
jgi:hypothetical protein